MCMVLLTPSRVELCMKLLLNHTLKMAGRSLAYPEDYMPVTCFDILFYVFNSITGAAYWTINLVVITIMNLQFFTFIFLCTSYV